MEVFFSKLKEQIQKRNAKDSRTIGSRQERRKGKAQRMAAQRIQKIPSPDRNGWGVTGGKI